MISIVRNEGFGWVSYGWAQTVGSSLYAQNGFKTEEEAMVSAERARADLELLQHTEERIIRISRDLVEARGEDRARLELERDQLISESLEIKRRVLPRTGGHGDGV